MLFALNQTFCPPKFELVTQLILLKDFENRTKCAWGLHAALRKVVENHRYKRCGIC